MKFTVTVNQAEDGCYVATCPTIPGCFAQAATEQEALRNIKSEIREALELRAEWGMPLIVRTHEVEIGV